MSSKLWPLGRGNYTQSMALTFLAAVLGVATLAMGCLACLDSAAHLKIEAACRFWAAALFAVLAVQYVSLTLYNPKTLATFLPTPADGPRLYALMDPTRRWVLRSMPYAFGLLAMTPLFPMLGALHAAMGLLFACSLFRLLAPLLVWAAVRWRKVVVPHGHWVVCATSVLLFACVFIPFPIQTPGEAEPLFLLDPISGWVWLLGALMFTAVEPMVRRGFRRRTIPLYRRDELVDLAFPTGDAPEKDEGRLLVEAIGGNSRRRRFLFAVQEATGLYRVSDWTRSGMLGAGVLVVLLALGWACGWRMGSGFHLLLTVAPLTVMCVWGEVRPLVASGGRIVNPLRMYALPVSHLEVFGTRVVALSILYFALGGALAVGFVWMGHGEQTVLGALAAAFVNLTHLWLLLLGSGAYIALVSRGRQAVLSTVTGTALFLLLMCSLQFMVMASVISPDAEKLSWTQHLPAAGRFVLTVIVVARDLSGGWEAFQASEAWLRAIPSWGFALWAWVYAVCLCAIPLHLFVTRARGHAHPAYGRFTLARQAGMGVHRTLHL